MNTINGSQKNAYSVSGTSPPTNTVEDRIFFFVFSLFKPVTEKQIQKAIRVRKSLLVKAIRVLIRNRILKRIGRGRRKEPFLYFVCGCSTCLQPMKNESDPRE